WKKNNSHFDQRGITHDFEDSVVDVRQPYGTRTPTTLPPYERAWRWPRPSSLSQ
ncbi:hypothetical protein CANTEDRAFT_112381, partial [Yamadazyma tenuis ATCC 10573]